MQPQLFALLASVSTVLAGGGYINTCRNAGWSSQNRAISAECADGGGGWHYTEIPLNWVMTNSNGVLFWQLDGNAMNSCSMTFHTHVQGSIYEFNCNGIKRSCDMNDHIFNNFGNLNYDHDRAQVFCYNWGGRMAGNETKLELPEVATSDVKLLPTLTSGAVAAATGKKTAAGKIFGRAN